MAKHINRLVLSLEEATRAGTSFVFGYLGGGALPFTESYPGSVGIMIGGMGTMAPERRDEIVSLGMRSLVAGTIATCMTGAVVGVIL